MLLRDQASLKHWKANAKPGESLGLFNRRIGMEGVINLLKKYEKLYPNHYLSKLKLYYLALKSKLIS